MTRKHTMLAVLIALTAIVGVPSAFAEIEVGNYGFTQMKNANLAFNTALDQFLVKIVEMANAINDNTAAITELQNTSGSDNQAQVDQNSADIQQVNATVFALETPIVNNLLNIADHETRITILESSSFPAIYSIEEFQTVPAGTNTQATFWSYCDAGDIVLDTGFEGAGFHVTDGVFIKEHKIVKSYTNGGLDEIEGLQLTIEASETFWQYTQVFTQVRCLDVNP